MCGGSGCCGGPPAAAAAPRRPRSRIDRLVTCSMRAALTLIGFEMFHRSRTSPSTSGARVVELCEEGGVLHRQLAVDLQARVRPAADPLAVVQVGRRRRAVSRIRLVVTAAGANRPRPAGLTVGLFRDVMRLEKRLLTIPAHAVVHGAELVRIGSRETMTERDVTVGGDAHQPDAGAAGIRLGVSLMDFLQRLAHVGEAVMAIVQRRVEVFMGERAELRRAARRSHRLQSRSRATAPS